MKKCWLSVAALSALLVTGKAWSADEVTSRCQEWAKEDGVSAEEMSEYIAQCLEEQRLVDTGTGGDPLTVDDNAGAADSPSD